MPSSPASNCSASLATSVARSGSNCFPPRRRASSFAASEPLQQRIARPEETECRDRTADAPELVVVLSGLEGDVVAEPLGLLVGVGVAADVDEQCRVVDGGPAGVVDADPLGKAQRDQALP